MSDLWCEAICAHLFPDLQSHSRRVDRGGGGGGANGGGEPFFHLPGPGVPLCMFVDSSV